MSAVASRCDVAVLGAGPAGLAAAWYSVRRGFATVVVERAPGVGGLASSLVVGGQSVDLGSHRLHPSVREDILGDLRDLGLDLQWRPRNGRIRLRDRWLSFPLRSTDLVRHAHPALALGALRDAAWAPVRARRDRRAGGADSFARQLDVGLGPAIARSFYAPYAMKLWAAPPEDLSAELFRRRVSAGSATAVLRRLLPRADPPGFWYPAGGFGAIGGALARDLRQRGGVLLTGTEIESIRPDPAQVEVHLRDGRRILARTVVSTVPSADLLGLTRSSPDLIEAARSLSFRGVVLVYLVVPRPRYSRFDAHYFPEPSTIVARLSEPKNYRDTRADPTNRTVLCAEVPSTQGDATWRADDGELGRRVRRELVEQGLPDPTPVSVHVERRPRVYPVYRLGFEVARGLVDDYVDRIPNVAVIGRQALFAHDNTHHALLMGRTAVDSLGADARLDRDAWVEARRAFADHVVED